MTSYAELKRRKNARKSRPKGHNSTIARAVAEPKATPPKQSLSLLLKKKTATKKGRGKQPPRKVNSTRRTKNWLRAYGSVERVAFVKTLPCAVSVTCRIFFPEYPIENAHIKTGGMGRKSDARFIVPLCSQHHKWLHKHGPTQFEKDYLVDLAASAATTERLWQEFQGQRNYGRKAS